MATILKLAKKIEIHPSSEGVKINKISSGISPLEFCKLLLDADNKVNPRMAKVNSITKAIHNTLDSSPELFWLKSKGLLIATEEFELLERNRVRLKFDNHDYEGIMDGGHNTFAIASWMIELIFDEKIKKWDECKEFWKSHHDEILQHIVDNPDSFEFTIPIEILFPSEEDGSIMEYYDFIAEICSARNNNVQLKETAKGNQVGFYDYLKSDVLQDMSDDIIWKTGEDGRVKSEDVIAMSCLPLLHLQENDFLPSGIKGINRISLYSQKSRCVDFFNELMRHPDISEEKNGKFEVKSELVKSALRMTRDVMEFFDRVLVEFPGLYHKAAPGKFGAIKSVDTDKEGRPLFYTTDKSSKYRYSHGFIYPLISGVIALIEYDQVHDRIRWSREPNMVDLEELDLRQYVELVKMVNFDPQKIGKGSAFYTEAENAFRRII